jgi:protein-tyrosine-phosphatase
MAGSAGSAAMAGSGAAGDAPEMAKKAGNCPSTVLGAVTKAEIKGKDIVLTITADDKDAVASIQKRAEEVVKEKKDNKGAAGAAHDQKGTHGGGIGLCPVHLGEGGTAKVKKDAKGVTITITPKDKPEELKTNIDDRIKRSAEWVEKNIKQAAEGNKGAVGGGKGAHGSTHQGAGDSKGKERTGGSGGGAGTGGGGGKGTGAGSATK